MAFLILQKLHPYPRFPSGEDKITNRGEDPAAIFFSPRLPDVVACGVSLCQKKKNPPGSGWGEKTPEWWRNKRRRLRFVEFRTLLCGEMPIPFTMEKDFSNPWWLKYDGHFVCLSSIIYYIIIYLSPKCFCSHLVSLLSFRQQIGYKKFARKKGYARK